MPIPRTSTTLNQGSLNSLNGSNSLCTHVVSPSHCGLHITNSCCGEESPTDEKKP
ncbi:hypothetical protein HanPSC8_Chr10g0437561 [Helianthus annuus]|nr:hypothetical protein HanPSC8_Chr10g0437561 [Helianthus annuus]